MSFARSRELMTEVVRRRVGGRDLRVEGVGKGIFIGIRNIQIDINRGKRGRI